MAGETILVVDDDQGLLILMQARLEAAGYQVVLAAKGEAALVQMQKQGCDLAIVDLFMPGMDGMTLLEHLLRLYPSLPVIMLTAKGMELELPRLRDEHKIPATFLKPFSPKEIVKAVEDCLVAVS